MIDWESFYGAFRKPDFIAGYEVLNHLGGGAFGEVYKARKTSIGKHYAVKFLRLDQSGGADGPQRDAAERELDSVRLFAAIDHPNLVTIEDMGVVMGVPYLIMGYGGEDTLARRLKRADLDRDSALRYFVQVARGVLALHDRRLAHFDLKPSNVFLNGDVARVGDYGLAKLLTEGRATLSFGRGTPHYMAPEMLRNRADHRADLYSLGVILFESLTFRLPFGADPAGGFVVRDDDGPPQFPTGFPLAVRPVVERCLRLEPEQRFASVHELLQALGQTARQGDSVRLPWPEGAPPPSPASVASRPPSTSKAGASAAPNDTPRVGPGSQRPGSPRPGSQRKEELRQAAVELARGAVGLARGVWDGVVDRVGTRESGTQSEEDVDGSEVLVIRSLEDPDEEALLAKGSFSSPDAPWRAELARGRAVAPRVSGGGPAALATVPVPPRAEGGVVGSVVQSIAVGAEIMGTVVTGPALALARSSAQTLDRTVRGLPAVLGALVRLLLFLLLMVLLGAVCAFVLLAALALNP